MQVINSIDNLSFHIGSNVLFWHGDIASHAPKTVGVIADITLVNPDDYYNVRVRIQAPNDPWHQTLYVGSSGYGKNGCLEVVK